MLQNILHDFRLRLLEANHEFKLLPQFITGILVNFRQRIGSAE
jgi:hypothetical protein